MNGVDFTRLPQPVLSAHPEWVRLWDLAWRLGARNIRLSRGRRHMDTAWDPARNYQWVWDTCFMALYCRYAADQYPGVESLDNFYELQRSDGYVSMTYDLDTGAEPWPDRINPPLFAWAEWEHFRSTGDASRLPRIVGNIERLMDWIDANRRTAPHRRRRSTDGPRGGLGQSADEYQLYFFEDCGSSGMDDSPRAPRNHDAGRFFDWIDLSSQMALSFRMLARMHGALGNSERAGHWARRAEEVGRLVNSELWCERTRFYHDRTLPQNFVSTKTVAGFWPILAGICTEERLDALVAHLRDEREFNRPTPVPSLAADDPNYSPEGVYWLGGVWAPTNYMITRGLMQAGRGDAAHEIAAKFLDALVRTYRAVEPHSLWECYSPEADRPGLADYRYVRVKPDFVGWTGIAPIAMLIENLIGLDLDAAEGIAVWTLRLTEEHGIRQLCVGPGARADFHCDARPAPDAPATVHVRSDRELRVQLHRGAEHVERIVKPGPAVALTF